MTARNQVAAVAGNNRRRGWRFPIREGVRYVLFQHGTDLRGTGTTVNVSSSGLQFTVDQALPVGNEIEVTLDWPARLDGGCMLKFVGRGRVVRSSGDRVAVKIFGYEFRTRASAKDKALTSSTADFNGNR